MNAITCSHGVALNVIDEGPSQGRDVIICTGLTSNIAHGSTSGYLAVALAAAGWASRRFDYCGSLDPADRPDLRTMDRMREDIASVLSTSSAEALIARGRAAQPALRAITPAIRHVVLWAPIIWVDQPHSDLKAKIMQEVDDKGFAMIDGTRVGREFLHALDDPTDDEVASWVRPDCRHHRPSATGRSPRPRTNPATRGDHAVERRERAGDRDLGCPPEHRRHPARPDRRRGRSAALTRAPRALLVRTEHGERVCAWSTFRPPVIPVATSSR